MDFGNLQFRKMHGETEWLKPFRTDGKRITEKEIDQIIEFLDTIESRDCSTGNEPLALRPN
jgi:hypothetical protein